MRRAAPLLLLAACGGCSTLAPDRIEAPPALTAQLLAKFSGSSTLVGDDVEGGFALGPAEATPPAQPSGFGFDRPLDGAGPSEADVARLLDRRVDLTCPSRLACVEAQATREFVEACVWGGPDVRYEPSAWQVRPVPPQTVEAIRAALDPAAPPAAGTEDWPAIVRPRRAAFSAVGAIPGLFLPAAGDLGQVRYAAARIGADALLVYARSTRVYTFRNGLANLYPTLVGLLLPGSERIVVSRAEGAIVDVRTGHVFCVAQGEARLDEASSPLLASSDDARQDIERAETEAALRMARDLARELASLEAAGRLRDRGGAAQ